MRRLLIVGLLAVPVVASADEPQMTYSSCIARLTEALENDDEIGAFWMSVARDAGYPENLIYNASAIIAMISRATDELAAFCEELRQS